MPEELDAMQVAVAFQGGLVLYLRKMRQIATPEDLSLPETSTLARLDQVGSATSSSLAQLEGISPQSMGATLSSLKSRGLVDGCRDSTDGRRVIVSVTDAGRQVLNQLKGARVRRLCNVLTSRLTTVEIDQIRSAIPLIARLAAQM